MYFIISLPSCFHCLGSLNRVMLMGHSIFISRYSTNQAIFFSSFVAGIHHCVHIFLFILFCSNVEHTLRCSVFIQDLQ